MKTVVYFQDGSIEQTAWADEHVLHGIARFATEQEVDEYERFFGECDNRIVYIKNLSQDSV